VRDSFLVYGEKKDLKSKPYTAMFTEGNTCMTEFSIIVDGWEKCYNLKSDFERYFF